MYHGAKGSHAHGFAWAWLYIDQDSDARIAGIIALGGSEVAMISATEQIPCPRNPDHGPATKQWLPPKEREMITRGDGEVYAIRCKFCGIPGLVFTSISGMMIGPFHRRRLCPLISS